MAAARRNLRCEQGADFDPVITWRTASSEGASGTPVDLTGWDARMQVRATISSDDVILELTKDNGKITLGGPDGTIALLLSGAETAEIPLTNPDKEAKYYYDLELVSPTGAIKRLIRGRFKVSPEVTR